MISPRSPWRYFFEKKSNGKKAVALLLLVLNGSMSFQPSFHMRLRTSCSPIEAQSPSTPKHTHAISRNHSTNMHKNGESEPVFDPLDVMLTRARKRGVNPLLKVQAFFGGPALAPPLRWLTRGDATFALIALLIGAKGFVLGLLLGKWTVSLGLLPSETNLPPQIVQLFPVMLAIVCDQLI